MKPLGPDFKNRLGAISRDVKERLEQTPIDPSLKLMRQTPRRTDTYGWACSVARLPGTGEADFELWFDLFPNVGRPVLSLSFWAANRQRVLQVAKAFAAHERPQADFDNDDLLPLDGGHQRMRAPLPRRLFNRPLVEFYDSPFLTVYLATPTSSRAVLVESVLSHLAPLIGAAAGALRPKGKYGEFPLVTERKLVRRHELWERSRSIAQQAKIRDGFTCTICQFNFGAIYGNVGRGYAEAHHKKALGFFRSKTARHSADDLVTVCANCHRMLHKLKGGTGDVNVLRQKVRSLRKSRVSGME